ncbi:conserved Plasmodium protein, unknown function [Plasmodium sp. gorilla clade G3]|nr:conserved Plasmodium protein, unknown function [Plasmodium sp. gorilla clade G3]
MNLFPSGSEKSYKDIFDWDENICRRQKRKNKILDSSNDSNSSNVEGNNIKNKKKKDEEEELVEYNLFNSSSSDNNNEKDKDKENNKNKNREKKKKNKKKKKKKKNDEVHKKYKQEENIDTNSSSNNNDVDNHTNNCNMIYTHKEYDENPFSLFSSNTYSDNNINKKSIEKNEYCLFSNNSESELCCDNKKKNETYMNEKKMYSLFSSDSEYNENIQEKNINNKKNNISNNIFDIENNDDVYSKDEKKKKKDVFLKWTPHKNIKRSYNKKNFNKRTYNDNNILYKNYKNTYNNSRKSKGHKYIKQNYKNKDMKNKVNNLFKEYEKGEYRLVNFEKLKKRAYRKLNFLSIVDVAKSLSDVSEENTNYKKKKPDKIYEDKYVDNNEDTYNENNQGIYNNNQYDEKRYNRYERDILNNSICSSDSFYKSNESFFLHEKYVDSTNLDSIENDKYNNQTLDIYNYYYLNNQDERNKDNKYLEKIVYNSTNNNCDDLYNYLFKINDSSDKDKESTKKIYNNDERNMNSNNIFNDEDNLNDQLCEVEQKKEKHQTNETNKIHHILDNKDNLFNKKRIRRLKRHRRKKDDFLLKRNIILYRNFKNINNEISRQNNKKGFRFKEMIGDFIRVLNKNVLKINEQNEKNQKKKKKENQYYEKNINNNMSNIDGYNISDNNTNFNLFDDDTSDVESFINFECYSNSCDMMEKASCDCLFCIQHKKILNKNELYLILFKYIEDNKTEGTTIIKPYFLNIYVFTCFINFFIHYKNISICKLDDIDGNNHNCDNKYLDDYVNNMNNTCKDQKGANCNNFNKKMKKKLYFYKYSRSLYMKYQINKMVYFIPKRIVLTTVAICIYGVNFLNKESEEEEEVKEKEGEKEKEREKKKEKEKEKEECIAIINFLRWKKVRKNFYEILKLKKKRKENLMIYKKCFFFINAIDEYCNMCNIPIDDTYSYNTQKNKKNKKKNLHNRMDTHLNLCNNKTNTYDNSFDYYNQAEMQKIQKIQKVEEIQYIQDILNSNLQVNNIQFLFFDPIYVSSKKYVHFYPSHLIMLF